MFDLESLKDLNLSDAQEIIKGMQTDTESENKKFTANF